MSASSSAAPVGSVLGTMTFGWRYSSEECGDAKSLELMETFLDAGHVELDTALAYSGGETEKIMGRIFEADPSLMERCTVATKANPWPGGNMTSSAGEGGLAPSELRAQVEASRASLSPYGPIDLLYLHAPDAATEIDETLAELKAMHDEGAFVNLGLSNFPAWEVAYIHGKCAEIGLPPPTTYQGMYNCVTRAVEPELIPALRKLNMRFLAYNPLAGGLLTGKHRGKMSDDDTKPGARGRFTENKMYRDRFWNERYFAAVDTVCAACETHGVAPAEAALRWLYSHSRLDGAKGDCVILGASSAAHLEANLAAAEKAANGEALPESVLEAIEAAFEVCAPVAPPYSRGHSKIAVGR